MTAGTPLAPRTLRMAKEFQKDYAKLEKSVQDKVRQLPRKFETPELIGTHVEPVNNAAHPRFRTVRVDRSVRAVVIAPETGNNYTLVKVLPHDDAYTWVQRTRMDISKVDGTIDFWDPTRAPDAEANVLPGLVADLFSTHSDTELLGIGLSPDIVAFARSILMSDDLDRAQQWMPPSQWQVLSDLAAGIPIGSITARVEAAAERHTPVDNGDELDAAIERSVDQFRIIDDEDDFNRILDYPFDVWRNYLHPSQVALVSTDYDGPAQISGGPGTGKTVVCVHRAKRLAQRNDGYVLLTTYNKTLAVQMERNVDLLVDDADVRQRIKIRTIDSFARRVFEYRHGRLDDSQFMARPANFWQKIANDQGIDFTGTFLHEEHVKVILAQNITTETDYLAARRRGRGRALGAAQRRQVWHAAEQFNRTMAETGKWTFETILHEAARTLANNVGDDVPGYRYVIVDEAQDLTTDHWRLLRAAVTEQPNALFISGDNQQAIYRRPTSLRALGINVVGRSTRLHKNHRVSAEILRWAHDFLNSDEDVTPDLAERDDTSEGEDSESDTASFSGYSPVTRGFDTQEGELAYVVETISDWVNVMGHPANEIGVLARSHGLLKELRAALNEHWIFTRELKDTDQNGVAVGTMHSAKGLEFRCAAVVGVSDELMPPAGVITPESDDRATHLSDLEQERKLLFVACTRAREDLLVTWTGNASRFINPDR